MYYTDSEIYHKIKQGVDPQILAELNGCSIKLIKQAYDRYQSVSEAKDATYKQLREQLENRRKLDITRFRGGCTMKVTDRESETSSKFKYNDNLIDQIKQYLEANISKKEIYDTLFAGTEDKPNYTAFATKCRKLLREMGIPYEGRKKMSEFNSVVKPTSQTELSETASQNKSSHELRLQHAKLLNEIHELELRYKQSLKELIKLEIQMEQLFLEQVS